LLEPIVAELFERRTGKRLFRVNQTIIHPQHEWMTCNIDRRVVGEKSLAEIKTAGHWAAQSDEWGEPGSDAVPFRYAVQVQHQLACLQEYERGYVPLLVAGQHYRCFEVQRDPDIIAMLEEMLAEFWRCVIEGEPPKPTNLAQAKERWPQSVPINVEATTEILAEVVALREANAAIKAAEAAKEEAQGKIALFLGLGDTLTAAGKPLLTYKTQSRAEHIVKASTFRVMRLK
jgi:predicted phage-related endonuclease